MLTFLLGLGIEKVRWEDKNQSFVFFCGFVRTDDEGCDMMKIFGKYLSLYIYFQLYNFHTYNLSTCSMYQAVIPHTNLLLLKATGSNITQISTICGSMHQVVIPLTSTCSMHQVVILQSSYLNALGSYSTRILTIVVLA